MGLVLVLIKKAMITAGVVVKHRGGDVVGANDVNAALMHESMTFFESETLETDLEDMLRMLEETMSDDEDGVDGERLSSRYDSLIETLMDEAEQALPDEDPPGSGTVDCTCDICSKIEGVEAAWAAWDPEDDPVKLFLKEHLSVVMAEGLGP